MTHTRYGIYYLPPPGAFAQFGAAWVGWNVESGRSHAQFDVDGIAGVTKSPRKYGFHATLKPPFRLAEGGDVGQLTSAVETLAKVTPPASTQALTLTRLGRFLALTPVGDASEISRLARACVIEIDTFRAPAAPQELVKRRAAGLNAQQDQMLLRWGYPYVLDAFRFHITLTDRLPKADIDHWSDAVSALLPALPAPFVIDAICLVGERPDQQFELIERFALAG